MVSRPIFAFDSSITEIFYSFTFWCFCDLFLVRILIYLRKNRFRYLITKDMNSWISFKEIQFRLANMLYSSPDNKKSLHRVSSALHGSMGPDGWWSTGICRLKKSLIHPDSSRFILYIIPLIVLVNTVTEFQRYFFRFFRNVKFFVFKIFRAFGAKLVLLIHYFGIFARRRRNFIVFCVFLLQFRFVFPVF